MERPKIDKDPRKVLNFDDVQANNNKSRPSRKAPENVPDVSTGAIQKKKGAFRTIKPSNSFKHSEGKKSFFFFFKLVTNIFVIIKQKLPPTYSSWVIWESQLHLWTLEVWRTLRNAPSYWEEFSTRHLKSEVRRYIGLVLRHAWVPDRNHQFHVRPWTALESTLPVRTIFSSCHSRDFLRIRFKTIVDGGQLCPCRQVADMPALRLHVVPTYLWVFLATLLNKIHN